MEYVPAFLYLLILNFVLFMHWFYISIAQTRGRVMEKFFEYAVRTRRRTNHPYRIDMLIAFGSWIVVDGAEGVSTISVWGLLWCLEYIFDNI